MNQDNIPPGKYFISHSYKDAEVRDGLIKKLPEKVEPFIFPPISVAPHEFVSNTLIEAILACDGLIYLEEGASAKSFWVAFERDYAIRAKKRVFAYHPVNETFIRADKFLLNLEVFASCTAYDRKAVEKILEHMREQRYFNISDYVSLLDQKVPTKKGLRTSVVEKLNRGGYLVTFWTAKAAKSEYTRFEIEFAYEYGQSLTLNPDNPANGRVLIALLDDTALPDWIQNRLSDKTIMTKPVQIYGDKELSMTNRIDNLVVRLYWLIFRNQFPELVYE